MSTTKPIQFSQHAHQQMLERGISEDDVEETIRTGERVPAKRGRHGYRKNFQYNCLWGRRNYAIKQVLAIVVEEEDSFIVITACSFYF